MKRPTFLHSAILGLGISLAVTLLFNLLAMIYDSEVVIRGLVACASLAYLIALLRQSTIRVGCVTTLVFWGCLERLPGASATTTCLLCGHSYSFHLAGTFDLCL